MGIIEIILLIAGSGGVSGFITWAVTVKAQKKKENAIADQETVKARLDLHVLENQVFDNVVKRMQGLIDDLESENKRKDEINEKHQKTLKTVEENQKQLLHANEMLTGKVEHLEKIVQDYKETCDNCQFRLEKKKK
jgi:predicted RNase H-like nuclease (RuvC/YqgF family)